MESLGLKLNVKTAGPSPELRANILSYFSWQWVEAFMSTGNSHPIQVEDLYDLNPTDTTEFCERSWDEHYEKLKRNTEKPPVWKLVYRASGRDLVYSFLFCPVWLIAVISQVFIMRALIQEAEKDDQNLKWWRDLLFVCGMFITSSVQFVSQHWIFAYGHKSGIKVKAATSMAVFNKLMQLRTVALGGTSSGEMMNLVNNDTQKFLNAASFLAFSLAGIFNSVVVSAIAIAEVGISALPGIGIIILAQPVQFSVAQAVGRMRKRAVKFTDARVRIVAEILSGVRVVKYNGWTIPFLKRIEATRMAELRWIRKAAFLRASTSTLKDSIAPLAALVTFAAYVGKHNGAISASKAFTILSLYGILARVYSMAPAGVQYMWEAYIGLQRLQRLMDLPNGKGWSSPEDAEKLRKIYPQAAVAVTEATFSWQLNDEDFPSSPQPARPSVSKIHIGETNDKLNKQDIQTSQQLSSFREPVEKLSAGTLNDINLTVAKGDLIAVIGPVGSGKSSLLFALLGEMECTKGTFWTERMVSYAPQQPWILNDTIKNNIICSSGYDNVRYKQVIFACALEHDLQQLPAADETEIGERGVNLSGGQKARISLARACYALSPILLLDDPLAAVDVPTARHLMQHVLGGLLKSRTVIVITHNKSSLEFVDRVFLMQNGRLQEVRANDEVIRKGLMEEEEEENEHLDDLSDHDTVFSASFQTSIGGIQEDVGDSAVGKNSSVAVDEAPHGAKNSDHVSGLNIPASEGTQGKDSKLKRYSLGKNESRSGSVQFSQRKSLTCDVNDARKATLETAGALTVREDRVVGEVTWTSYLNYLRGGGLTFFALVLALMCFAQGVRVMVDYWVAAWVTDKYNQTTEMYLIFYAVLVVGSTILSLSRSLLFTEAAIRSARYMHQAMSEKVLRSPQLFFDQNPVGRILNRFSKDQAMVDELLPNTALTMLENLVGVVGVMIFIGAIIPWFLLTLPPFVLAFWYYQRRYLMVSRELKRVDGLTRSPIYAHFAQTLQGIVSVRAFGMEKVMHHHFQELMDANHRSYMMFVHTSRWLGVRLDFCAAICAITAAILTILLRKKISPGLIGVVLIQSVQLTGLFQYGVRMMADTENLFTSVERIQSYENLPGEADFNSPPGLISDRWPEMGEVEFTRYTMAYRVDLPPVLNDLSFKRLPKPPKTRSNSLRLCEDVDETSLQCLVTPQISTAARPTLYSKIRLLSKHGDFDSLPITVALMREISGVLIQVLPQEKVGILGRTGAGKSSLAAALFRMVENSACSGSILVDGIDLKLVGLDDLRMRLSIIPQDPVLFRGTVKLNLDPFELHGDDELHDVLAKVQLTKKMQTLNRGLSSVVEENGDNFSLGERQLLCLARSLLRRSKVIVMDEATASVDGETDQLIQQTMRSVFQNCTVLTIAHRIDTIIDCNRVLVLAKGGRISEFDTPANLLRCAETVNITNLMTAQTQTEHVFASMVAQAGPAAAKQLREAALAAEKKRNSSPQTSPQT